MAERLLGIETEYAFSAFDRAGRAVDRFAALVAMLRMARAQYPSLSDGTGRGVFLGNSCRFYLEAPDHPEWSTAECENPWDVLRYAAAGERVMESLATQLVEQRRRVAETVILRCNVDYSGSGATWGCHESYLHRCPPRSLPAVLLPHLVSRIVYSGAGGFDNRARYGLEFTLSPRVPHLEHDVSDQSTAARGIFHTKDEPMACEGFHRMHLLCGESNCSQTSAWLKVATTALVVAMADGGVSFATVGDLESPLAAMRRYSGDPTCRATARTGSGEEVSARDLQWRYLHLAEKHARRPFMPRWAGEVCERWRAVLEQLEAAPESVNDTLDWAIKHALFAARAAKRGYSWSSIEAWSAVLARVGPRWERGAGRADQRRELSLAALRDGGPALGAEMARLEARLRKVGASWEGLDDFLALRRELCEIDARYGQLGDRSIFNSLDAAGVLRHRVPGVEAVDRAVEEPPAGSRAAARGRAVHLLAARGGQLTCDWRGVWHRTGHCLLDLGDPFCSAADVTAEKLEERLAPLRDSGATKRRATLEDVLLEDDLLDARAPASLFEDLGDLAAAERAYLGDLRRAERRDGESVDVALACNQLGIFLRSHGRLEEAETYQRRALALDERLRGEGDAKVPHRLNNLAVVLVLLNRCDEAIALLDRAWRLKRGRHDVTSARILWVRMAAAMRRGETLAPFLGQLKSLLLDYPSLATAGGVSSTWQIDPVIDQLEAHLDEDQVDLLILISAAMHDRAVTPDLDNVAAWETQPPLDPDTPWPPL